MDSKHYIISISTAKELFLFRETHSIVWHLKMGLKFEIERLQLSESYPFKNVGWKEYDQIYYKVSINKHIAELLFCVTKCLEEDSLNLEDDIKSKRFRYQSNKDFPNSEAKSSYHVDYFSFYLDPLTKIPLADLPIICPPQFFKFHPDLFMFKSDYLAVIS